MWGYPISQAKKLKLKQPVLPTAIVMPAIVLLCIGGLPKWSPDNPSKHFSVIQWLDWFDYPGFPLAAVVSLVPLIGSLLTQLMELICQRANLTIMNDSFSAGIVPCIPSPHGQMNDGEMPEKSESLWLGTGMGPPPSAAATGHISRPETSTHALGTDMGIEPAPFPRPVTTSQVWLSTSDGHVPDCPEFAVVGKR